MKYLIYKFMIGLMLLCIAFDLFSLSSFLIAQGSDGMLTFINVNIWIKIFLVILFCVIYFYQNKIKYVDIIFIIIILLWSLSGRVLAHNPYPEDKILCGWFFIRTNQILVCGDTDTNCENVVNNRTICSKLSFWRIRIKNEKVDKVIFVGPFIWDKTKQALNTIYPLSEL